MESSKGGDAGSGRGMAVRYWGLAVVDGDGEDGSGFLDSLVAVVVVKVYGDVKGNA